MQSILENAPTSFIIQRKYGVFYDWGHLMKIDTALYNNEKRHQYFIIDTILSRDLASAFWPLCVLMPRLMYGSCCFPHHVSNNPDSQIFRGNCRKLGRIEQTITRNSGNLNLLRQWVDGWCVERARWTTSWELELQDQNNKRLLLDTFNKYGSEIS